MHTLVMVNLSGYVNHVATVNTAISLAVTLTLTKRLGHLNKVLALVVVADYAIVTRAFYYVST